VNRARLLVLLLDVILAFTAFKISYRIYRESTGLVQLCDSAYSLLVAEKVLATGSTDLRETLSADPAARRKMQGFAPAGDLPYHFTYHVDPRHPEQPAAIYYGYPVGSIFLSLPFMKQYEEKGGASMVNPDGVPNLEAESLLQQKIACRIVAATVVLFYIIARFFCSPFVAFLLTLGFGLGSPAWSTLSRSLWSHTWMVFWLSAAIVLMLMAKRRESIRWASSLPLGLGLGTALFAMAVTRPHAVLSVGPIFLYAAIVDRRMLASAIVSSGLWAAGYVAACYSQFGIPMPPSVYEAGAIDGKEVFDRFTWLMISPSRGLLVYCPYLLAIAAMLFLHRRSLRDQILLIPAGLSIGAYFAVFSAYVGWHAGCSYGPRYFCDILPWFVLLGAMALDGLRRADLSWIRKGLEVTVLLTTFAWGVWVHSRGANMQETWEWNYQTSMITPEEAAKDWRHPQFLAGITFVVKQDGSVVELP